jgi:hypothetical protein
MSGPIHRVTLSKNGRGSLLGDDGIRHHYMSRVEMGTIVHLITPEMYVMNIAAHPVRRRLRSKPLSKAEFPSF